MAYLPIVLGYRFLLVLIALFALGLWGWTFGPGFLRYLLMLALPGLAAAAWWAFGAIEPVEPKPIWRIVPGWVRLVLELGIFSLAVAALVSTGQWISGAMFGMGVILQYMLSLDRVSWLLKPG